MYADFLFRPPVGLAVFLTAGLTATAFEASFLGLPIVSKDMAHVKKTSTHRGRPRGLPVPAIAWAYDGKE